MSKIICDICGTSYPETAKRCPICGCVCDNDVQRATSEITKEGNVTTGYTYVKGGRFSKANVKKRNKENAKAESREKPVKEPVFEQPVQEQPVFEEPVNEEPAPEKSGRGLVITAVLLLVAIIAVLIYIAVKIFAPFSNVQNPDESTGSSMSQSIPCVNIVLDTTTTVVLEQAGEAVMLDVKREPANTTDTIKFESQDETIATVNSVGKITVVGNGTTKIVITCGDIVKEVEVTCQIEETTTEDTTEDTTEETTEDTTENETKEVLELNRKDITFDQKGKSWMLYSGTIAKNLITWSTDDATIATIEEGKVVAVGSGTTKVYAEYEDQKVSCVIRCVFKESTGVTGNGGVSEDGGNSGTAGNGGVSEDGGNSGATSTSKIFYIHTVHGKTSDFTMSIGQSYKLSLKDENGTEVQATWSASGSAASLSGSTVTGVEKGSTTVTATYNGIVVKCIVRVSK